MSTASYALRIFDVMSSSALIIMIITLALVAATIACLPVLLGLRIATLLFSNSSQECIDASIYSTSTDREAESVTESIFSNLIRCISSFASSVNRKTSLQTKVQKTNFFINMALSMSTPQRPCNIFRPCNRWLKFFSSAENLFLQTVVILYYSTK